MAKQILQILTLAFLLALAAQAQSADCNASAASPSVTIALPSRPFTAVPSHDGCWVFVSLTRPRSGIAVMKRGGGTIELSRVAPLESTPTGIVLTHDGKLLIAAADNVVIFLDVQRLISGAADPVLGSFSDGPNSESIYANVTADDKLLFVSEEAAESITVIDLERARTNGYKAEAIKGKIPTGIAPIALTFSPDGKWLYTTSQLAARSWNWPAACKQEGSPAGSRIVNPEGAVVVVDVALAGTDPAKSVAARIPAGCSAVRMAISPSGDRIYVTARNSNAVAAFDTAKLLTDADHARLGIAPVGSAPVPVAVVDGGRKVVAGNSNRFAGGSSGESLNVLDAMKIKGDADAGIGVIPAGSFPREMRVSDDGHTLFLTNFGSNSLQVMSVDHLIDAAGPAQAQKGPMPPAPETARAPEAAAGDAAAADLATAAEDMKNAGVALGYVSELSGAGAAGASRLAASRAAMAADTAAVAAETTASAVEWAAAKALAASAAGDKAAMNNARDKAASDYSALLAADADLAKAATDLAAASAGNVAFYAANAGAAAINGIGAQDASAAANLLSAVTKGGTAGYTAAAANEATAITNANAIASLDPSRAPVFQAAAKAEAEAQSKATAAAAGGNAAAAAAALAAAAIAGATADGPGNPYAGAVDTGAAAVANAVSATISAQQAIDRLKTLK